ncbi:MAG TPA: plastocyanin/azurin family copper-binding protein [Xanthomonadaceae bacterium]|nr:plastocyanin/azurin family copper-binding protein [Xanthomonadaceae bacterium]
MKIRLVGIPLLLAAFTLRAAEHFVEVGAGCSFSFTPAELTIEEGDTVTWVNVCGFHNVVADDGSFTSGPPAKGNWEFSHTFPKGSAGVHPYHCSAHSFPGGGFMDGAIIVEKAPQPDLVFADGFEEAPAP